MFGCVQNVSVRFKILCFRLYRLDCLNLNNLVREISDIYYWDMNPKWFWLLFWFGFCICCMGLFWLKDLWRNKKIIFRGTERFNLKMFF